MQQKSEEKSLAGRWFVPFLTLTCFSLYIIDSLTGVFLLDVTTAFFGSTDPVSVAITSQLGTVSSIVSVIFGFSLGALSVRFNHKKLLVFGSSCILLSAVGCFLAPNLIVMQIFYSIEGIGTIVASVMIFLLVAEMLAVNQRPKAIGWIIAGSPIAGIVANLVISFFFSSAGGWRWFLLWFCLPIALTSLAIAYFGVPSSPQKQTGTVGKKSILDSFKYAFLRKSAAACLIGNMIKMAGVIWITYIVAFLKTRFGLPTAEGALAMMGLTVMMAISDPAGGYLVNRIGRKNLLVATTIMQSVTTPFIALVSDVWVAVAIVLAAVFTGGLGVSAGLNLALEQVPESRGTMMSVNVVLLTLGGGIGFAVGGVALAFFNYTGMFVTYAALGFVAAAIFIFLTKDPCKP